MVPSWLAQPDSIRTFRLGHDRVVGGTRATGCPVDVPSSGLVRAGDHMSLTLQKYTYTTIILGLAQHRQMFPRHADASVVQVAVSSCLQPIRRHLLDVSPAQD